MEPQQPDADSIVRAERLVLRAMCQGTAQGSVRDAAVQILGGYNWREPVHLAMFNCLTQLPAGNPEFLRSELPACLTRKGFPDVEWEALFEPHSLTRQDAEQLMRELNARS